MAILEIHVNDDIVAYNITMIKILGKIPKEIVLACSGGPDSMAVLDFLSRSRRKIKVLHFDHGTEHASSARALVEDYCESNGIFYITHEILETPPKGESLEAWWRNRRYDVINLLEDTIVTGHNLNDVAEWWLFTSLRGNPRLMPYQSLNVIKPFILTEKETLQSWCDNHDVPYIIDPTNLGDRFARSKIRKNIIPHALDICPGFLGTIKRMLDERFKKNNIPVSEMRKILRVV